MPRELVVHGWYSVLAGEKGLPVEGATMLKWTAMYTYNDNRDEKRDTLVSERVDASTPEDGSINYNIFRDESIGKWVIVAHQFTVNPETGKTSNQEFYNFADSLTHAMTIVESLHHRWTDAEDKRSALWVWSQG